MFSYSCLECAFPDTALLHSFLSLTGVVYVAQAIIESDRHERTFWESEYSLWDEINNVGLR